MTKLKELCDYSTHEELAFGVADLMRPYIEDLNSIEYGFLNASAKDQVTDDISGLRQRSLRAIASICERLSRSVKDDVSCQEVMPILFSFLQDQLEVRLSLLGIYWERMKAQKFITTDPDLRWMGAMIHPLTELIQECADRGIEEEESTTQSDAPENCLAVG